MSADSHEEEKALTPLAPYLQWQVGALFNTRHRNDSSHFLTITPYLYLLSRAEIAAVDALQTLFRKPSVRVSLLVAVLQQYSK